MDKRLTAEMMATICCYHHGGLPDCIGKTLSGELKIPLCTRMSQIDKKQMEVVMERFKNDAGISENLITDMFDQANIEIVDAIKKICLNKMNDPFILNLFIKTLYSALIDADRYDAYLSDSGIDNVKGYACTSGMSTKINYYISNFNDYMIELQSKKSDDAKKEHVNQIRSDIYRQCLSASDRSNNLLTLTVPTGGGKTLSSMGFALECCKKFKKDRIIYVMPFTTIIEQNAGIIRGALLCGDDLLEDHSDVFEDDKAETYKLLTERWTSNIIFTTMVQFLNSFYHKGTQDMRRLHNLQNSIIVFDEVQAVPIKCIGLFDEAINYLTTICDTKVVLCSATQPTLGETSIPINNIELSGTEIIDDPHKYFNILKRVEIINETDIRIEDYEECADYILEKKGGSRSALFVANRIKTVQELYRILKNRVNKETIIYALTTRICPAQRKERIREMLKSLKDNDVKSVICISTPLIEAGVDVSFDVGIRSLTGLSSIIQTAGRVNRNGEKGIASCYVIKPEIEQLQNTPEIQIGAIHAMEMLHGKTTIQIVPEVIKKYFKLYYSDASIEKQFRYPIDKDDIYSMLTLCEKNLDDYDKIMCEIPPLMLWYKFKKAANYFEVIDQPTVPVVVPYGKALNMIEQINNENAFMTLSQKMSLIKSLMP